MVGPRPGPVSSFCVSLNKSLQFEDSGDSGRIRDAKDGRFVLSLYTIWDVCSLYARRLKNKPWDLFLTPSTVQCHFFPFLCSLCSMANNNKKQSLIVMEHIPQRPDPELRKPLSSLSPEVFTAYCNQESRVETGDALYPRTYSRRSSEQRSVHLADVCMPRRPFSLN